MESIRIAPQQSQHGTAGSRLFQAVRNLLRHVKIQRRERSLRVCESLSIGDKRSILVVEFESKRYLLAATSQSISLLDRLSESQSKAGLTSQASSFPDHTFVSTLEQ
jgi:flagellar biogenesis protein FliO